MHVHSFPRFDFLDFSEYSTSDTSSTFSATTTTSGVSTAGDSYQSSGSEGSPFPVSAHRTKMGSNPQLSPLVTTSRVHGSGNSPLHSPKLRGDSMLLPPKLSNGLLEMSHLKGHSRTGSSGSAMDSGVERRSTGLESRSLPSFTPMSNTNK